MTNLGVRNKSTEASFLQLEKELVIVNQRIEYETDLAKLGSLDARGNPIPPTPPVTTVVHSAYSDLEQAKIDAKGIQKDIDIAKRNKATLFKDATKKGQDALEAHAKEVAIKQKHITQ